MKMKKGKDRAVEVMTALLDKLGYLVSPDKEGAVVSAYATDHGMSVSVIWDDKEYEL